MSNRYIQHQHFNSVILHSCLVDQVFRRNLSNLKAQLKLDNTASLPLEFFLSLAALSSPNLCTLPEGTRTRWFRISRQSESARLLARNVEMRKLKLEDEFRRRRRRRKMRRKMASYILPSLRVFRTIAAAATAVLSVAAMSRPREGCAKIRHHLHTKWLGTCWHAGPQFHRSQKVANVIRIQRITRNCRRKGQIYTAFP